MVVWLLRCWIQGVPNSCSSREGCPFTIHPFSIHRQESFRRGRAASRRAGLHCAGLEKQLLGHCRPRVLHTGDGRSGRVYLVPRHAETRPVGCLSLWRIIPFFGGLRAYETWRWAMALVGYARVSSVEQSVEVQLEKLKHCDKIYAFM